MGKKLFKKDIEIFARSIFLKGLFLRDTDKIPKEFSRWNKKFINFEKLVKKKKISKAEACIRFVKSFKEVKKIIFGFNNIKQLKENIIFSNKNKILFPTNLNINSGKILDPRKWKV